MRPTKSLIRNAGVPSTAASAVMVWLSPRKNAAPASAWWMRSGRRAMRRGSNSGASGFSLETKTRTRRPTPSTSARRNAWLTPFTPRS